MNDTYSSMENVGQIHRFMKQVLAILCAVDLGWITIEDFVEHPAGMIEYRLSNRWSVTVFFDVGDWDYIDSVRVPDGREVDLWADDLREEGYCNLVRNFEVDPAIWRVAEARAKLGYA